MSPKSLTCEKFLLTLLTVKVLIVSLFVFFICSLLKDYQFELPTFVFGD